jgi:hypothetical protein
MPLIHKSADASTEEALESHSRLSSASLLSAATSQGEGKS